MGLRTHVEPIRARSALLAGAILLTALSGTVPPASASSCLPTNTYSDTSFPLFVKQTCSFSWVQDLDEQAGLSVQGSGIGSSILIRLRVDVLAPSGEILLVCETPADPGWAISPAVCVKTNAHFLAPDGATLTCRVIVEAPSGLGVIFLHGHYGCARGSIDS